MSEGLSVEVACRVLGGALHTLAGVRDSCVVTQDER